MKTKPIPFMRKYEISECGVVVNAKTRNVMKLKSNGKSINITGDNGKYTTRTISGLLEITWGKRHV